MKHVRKIFAFAVALFMAFAVALPAFAATNTDSQQGGTASIKVTLPDDRSGNNTYKVYKVFDATTSGNNISYSLVSGKENVPNNDTFVLDDGGNVYIGTTSTTKTDADGEIETKVNGIRTYITPQNTELNKDQISAIANYVANDDPVATVTAGKDESDFTVTHLQFGYYYITTTTGTAVTVDSTKPNAEVEDKNIITTVQKRAGTEYNEDALKAIAAVGTPQPFTAKIVKNKGAINMVYTDTMTNMTYDNNLKVKVDNQEIAPSAGSIKTYTVVPNSGNTGFTVTFENDWIATLDDPTEIYLNYSGTITSAALSTNPAKNEAMITTGTDPNNKNEFKSDDVLVYNAKFTVTKQDGKGQALEGAGFVIKNSNNKYYKLVESDTNTNAITPRIDWVDSIDDATEYTSNDQGAVQAFTGLSDGTYTLVEKTVPTGYNKVADSTFTIAGNDYTPQNLEQTSTVINNAGTEMPSTGGIGTTIFYVVGGVMVAGAVVFLLTKRRVNAE